jgi:ribonuclease P/MRP protein subunit RPP40
MYTRLLSYLESNKILIDNQYGFRKGHSTYMALLRVVNSISEELDNNFFSLGLFVDLSKAFDTVDHKILIKKMEHYGVRGVALRWFTSYLSHRTQYVSLNNVDSKMLPVRCGVPQGSILGPLLFILFINDIVHSSKLLEYIIFADDTNLFFKAPDLNTLYANVNNELIKISKWFKLNKLSLNIKKTSYILFRGKQQVIDNTNLCIKIDSMVIDQVEKTKFLGVIINSTLTWEDHINTISNKISKNIGILYRTRNNLTTDTLLTLYHTLIEPYLNYCNLIWASLPSVYLERLFLKQKKAVRLITKARFLAHTEPLFSKLNLLTLFHINKLQIYCFMYRINHNLFPFFSKLICHEQNGP